mmetsp:Transcript_31508/g.53914  ORF Transcript_31508/g.53914 Transcript_31508/m.53914 type:complete len:179 (+) Transcript_31508:68-604(+)
MANSAAFEEHVSWIRSMREAAGSQLALDARRSASDLDLRDLGDGDLPSARLSWSESERGGDAAGESQGAEYGREGADAIELAAGLDRALDFDDFEEPIYRSLGYLHSAGVDDQEVGHEPPVYRSLGGALEGGCDDDFSAADEGMWPLSMPPLVSRQRAGDLQLVGGLDSGAGALAGFP